MAVTDMKRAGLEIGCEVEIIDVDQAAAEGRGSQRARARTDDHAHLLRNLKSLGLFTVREDYRKENGLVEIESHLGARHTVPGGDVIRTYADTQRARSARLDKLVSAYPTHDPPEGPPATIERFCGLSKDRSRGGDDSYWLNLADTFEDCTDYLADESVDGWEPVAVFDLDTGERIEIEVHTPVITRSDKDPEPNVLDEGRS